MNMSTCLMFQPSIVMHRHLTYETPRMLQTLPTIHVCPHWWLDAHSPHFHQSNLMVCNLKFKNYNLSLANSETWVSFKGTHYSHCVVMKGNLMEILCSLRNAILLAYNTHRSLSTQRHLNDNCTRMQHSLQ